MILLTHILLEYHAGIVTTKAKGIAETSTNLALLGLVECEVQIIEL